MVKLMAIAVIATILVLTIILIKYKAVYKVTISGKEVGYVINKYEFEKLIEEEIINSDENNIAFVDIETFPSYSLVLADSDIETNEQEIFSKINEEAIVTYKMYTIAVNGNNTAYVNSIEEAEEAVEEIKEQYKEKLDEIDISVNEVYTKDLNVIEQTVEVASAVDSAEVQVIAAVKEQEKIKAATLDGVYFGTKPVSGIITSRYGSRQGTEIVSSNHTGIDIGAPYGTDIVAAAPGKVTYSGWMGGYGNLIIITHDNGIQTYYGHCSKLYAKVGDEVEAGDLIAAVGSTGNSTGNHLHFEIRKNGSPLNPQRYIYK